MVPGYTTLVNQEPGVKHGTLPAKKLFGKLAPTEGT